MIYVLLYASALLFFILDYKIRYSAVAGAIVTVGASCGLFFTLSTIYSTEMAFVGQNIDTSLARTNRSLLQLNLIVFFSLVFILAFSAVGKCVGKLLFKSAKDDESANKKAKKLFVISSVIATITGILFFAIYLIFTKVPIRISRLTLLKIRDTIGIPQTIPLFMTKYYVLFAVIILIGIVLAVLINTKIPFFKEISKTETDVKDAKSGNTPLIIGLVLACIGNVLAIIITFTLDNGMKNLKSFFSVSLLLLAGLLFLIIGTRKAAKKADLKPALPVIAFVLAIASFADLISMSKKVMPFLSALVTDASFMLASAGADLNLQVAYVRQGPTLIRNCGIFLLVFLLAGLAVTLFFLIKSSAKKQA